MKFIQSNIKKAKKYLDKNHCVAVPTETVYGLAGNAYSDLSIKKIFKLKKRPKINPLIIHFKNLKDMRNDVFYSPLFVKLYKQFCPGPITFVLKKKKSSLLPNIATANLKTVAVRVPRNKTIRKILKSLNLS